MSEEKFTQGSWKIEPESDGNIWIVSDESIEAIANVCSGYNDATKKYEPEEKELANAKLIVSAPKMKEAIAEVIEVLDGNGVPNIEWVKKRLIEALS